MTRRECLAAAGESVVATAHRLRAEGHLADGDVDAIVGFAAFLRDAARYPHGRGLTGVPTDVVRKHREALGLTDEAVDALARHRGES